MAAEIIDTTFLDTLGGATESWDSPLGGTPAPARPAKPGIAERIAAMRAMAARTAALQEREARRTERAAARFLEYKRRRIAETGNPNPDLSGYVPSSPTVSGEEELIIDAGVVGEALGPRAAAATATADSWCAPAQAAPPAPAAAAAAGASGAPARTKKRSGKKRRAPAAQPAPEADYAGPREPRSVPFSYEGDERAEHVTYTGKRPNVRDVTDKVINLNAFFIKARAFGGGFMFNQQGDGALCSPFAAEFFAEPGVAQAFVRQWARFAAKPPGAGGGFVLQDFAAAGGYKRAWEALEAACTAEGLAAPRLAWALPQVTVGPPKMSDEAQADPTLMERVATLEFRLPMPVGSVLAKGRARRTTEPKDTVPDLFDRSYPHSKANYRPKRHSKFEERQRTGTAVASEYAAVREQVAQAREDEAWVESLLADQPDTEAVPGAVPFGGAHPMEPCAPAPDDELDIFVVLRGSGANIGLLACSPIGAALLTVTFEAPILCC